jgi:hypothetical protein
MHPDDRRFLTALLLIALVVVVIAVLGATGQLGYAR